MARQRHCRRLARNGKPAASLLTPSSSEPRTPAWKARVLDARKWLRERDGLSAGGRWIRTIGSWREGAGFFCGRRIAGDRTGAAYWGIERGRLTKVVSLRGYRWFESISLQRRVSHKLDFPTVMEGGTGRVAAA